MGKMPTLRGLLKATVARKAGLAVVRFSAASSLTPELVRQKMIAEWRVAKAGPLPEEMGYRTIPVAISHSP